MSGREWAVVIRGTWYLPHLVNMLKEYRGNGGQVQCRDEVIAQIEAQMVPVDGDSVWRTSRPLVVIDPEDREQVERLEASVREANGWNLLHHERRTNVLQAALREFANPAPPKPDEPTGLGAVVEDADGNRWVRDEPGSDAPRSWYRRGEGSCRFYRNIAAVRVLSEGVQP